MKSLKTIVENIMSCNYKCEEGDLSQNPDFHALMSLAGIPIHYVIEKSPIQYMALAIPKREHLVKFAKEYIEDLKKARSGHWEYESVSVGYNAQYIVNPLKRTVVCLLRGYMDGKVIKRGIAKCDPKECFNEHIGKAIALSRALGKETPIDFFSAPEPEGFEVGDILKYEKIPDTTYRIDEKGNGKGDLTIVTCDEVKSMIGHKANSDNNFSSAKVINDSARY